MLRCVFYPWPRYDFAHCFLRCDYFVLGFGGMGLKDKMRRERGFKIIYGFLDKNNFLDRGCVAE